AEAAAHGRRVSLRRAGNRPRGGGRRAPTRASDARSDGRPPLPPRKLRKGAFPRRPLLGRAPLSERTPRVRGGPVRSPALHPVLLGHDRTPQGDRARTRRDPPRARENARAPPRSGRRRPLFLV